MKIGEIIAAAISGAVILNIFFVLLNRWYSYKARGTTLLLQILFCTFVGAIIAVSLLGIAQATGPG